MFSATPFSTYNVGLVTSDFLDDPTDWQYALPLLEDIRNTANSLKAINKTDCMSRYVGKTAGLASLLLVSVNHSMSQSLSDDTEHPSSSLLTNFTTIEGDGTYWGLNSDWMCSAWAAPGRRSSFACTSQFLMTHTDTWTLGYNFGFKVDYCLALDNGQVMDNAYALRSSPAIMIIVTGLNLFKCFCIAWTISLHRRDSWSRNAKSSVSEHVSDRRKEHQERRLLHLVTLGDAVASFLEERDEHTEGLDLSTMKTLSLIHI